MRSFDFKSSLREPIGRIRERSIRGAPLVFVALLALLAAPSSAAAEGPVAAAPASGDEVFPSLSRVMALAKERAPDVVSARMGVGVANAAYAGARLPPVDNPYLEVFVDRGLRGATRDATVQANLWIPIEVSGQRAKRIAEADALVSWQEANLAAIELLVTGDAVRAYGGALIAAARERTLVDIVSVARAEASFYAERLAAGDTTLQDERLASVELGRTTVLLEESRADLARALAELARVTGHVFAVPSGVPVEPPPPKEKPATAEIEPSSEDSAHVEVLTKEADYFARARDRVTIDAHTPVNVIVSMGRGDLGEPRFGGGFSWTFPVLRRNQGEAARADAERLRALAEADVRRRVLETTLRGLRAEREEVRRAIATLDTDTEPAARDSVEAAVATKTAGKGDTLRVLTARRDLAMVRLRRLELVEREWSIVGDIVALTGELP